MPLTFGGKRRPGGSGPRTPLDPLEQKLTDRIAAVLRTLASAVDVDAFVEAIEGLDPDRLEQLLNDLQVGRLGQILENTMADVFRSNGNSEIDAVIRANPDPYNPLAALEQYGVTLPNGIRMPVVPSDLEFAIPTDPKDAMFRYMDDRAVYWAQTRSADLVTSINESNKLAIRQTISEAFTTPRTSRQTAKALRDIVGLHPRWARAVQRADDQNYARLIRDGMTPEQARSIADNMTKRYRDRLIRRRAEMIARTEIQQAQNWSRQAAWDVGQKQGFVSPASMKEWRTAPVGSQYGPPCPECMEMRGKRVPWNGSFPNGLSMPPAHPHCRCTAVLVPPSRGLEGLPSQDMGSWLERLDRFEAEQMVVKHLLGQHDQKTHGGGAGEARTGMRIDGDEIQYGTMSVYMPGSDYDRGQELQAADSDWRMWGGNYEMRTASARMMGITSGFDARGKQNSGYDPVGEILRDPRTAEVFGIDAQLDAQPAIRRAALLMEESTQPLNFNGSVYRGLRLLKDDPRLTCEAGDEFEMPLSSFATSRRLPNDFASGLTAPGESPSSSARAERSPVMLTVKTPARGHVTGSIGSPDSGHEVVMQGRFRVVERSQSPEGRTEITLEQVAYYDIRLGEWADA